MFGPAAGQCGPVMGDRGVVRCQGQGASLGAGGARRARAAVEKAQIGPPGGTGGGQHQGMGQRLAEGPFGRPMVACPMVARPMVPARARATA